jgi:hypothetical protein
MSRVVGTPTESFIKLNGSTEERFGAYKHASTAILDAFSCLNIELPKVVSSYPRCAMRSGALASVLLTSRGRPPVQPPKPRSIGGFDPSASMLVSSLRQRCAHCGLREPRRPLSDRPESILLVAKPIHESQSRYRPRRGT